MKKKALFALMVMVIKSTLVSMKPTQRPVATTQGTSGANLSGKMFTLSKNQDGITLFPPNYQLSHSPTTKFFSNPTAPTPTPNPNPTAPAPTPKTTTAIPSRGWSVCLRYLTDAKAHKIFTICPSCRWPVRLSAMSKTSFCLSPTLSNFNYNCGYGMTNFVPDINFLSVSELDLWTKVCLTVDTVKLVAQVFSGSNMSIRKMLASSYPWTGEPVIRISDFEGQVTDVQMWDYPLNLREVSIYMNYRDYRGSILTWSDISYSVGGNMILEDVFEEPISRGRRRHRLKGEKTRRVFTKGGNKL